MTGRRIHALVGEGYSLWTVQEALKALSRLGLINSQTIGRAGAHTINEGHISVRPLRGPSRSDCRPDQCRARTGR